MAKLNLSFGLLVQIVHNTCQIYQERSYNRQWKNAFEGVQVTVMNISILSANYFWAVKDKYSDLRD